MALFRDACDPLKMGKWRVFKELADHRSGSNTYQGLGRKESLIFNTTNQKPQGFTAM